MTVIASFSATARDPALRRVATASIAFNVAEWATWVAMLVYAYQRGGAVASSVVAVIQLVPAALFAPVGASLADRFPRARMLTVAYLAQSATMAATAAALFVDAPIPVVYALAACAATSITLTRPAQNALLPALTPDRHALTAANAVLSAIENASIVAGPAIAGVMLAAAGAGFVFAVMAAWLALSSVLVAGIVLRDDAVRARDEHATVKDGIVGRDSAIRELASAPNALLLIALLAVQQLQVGALDVLFVALALSALGIGETGVGLLTSAVGLGGIAGAVIAAAIARRGSLPRWMALGAIAWGAGLMLVAPARDVAAVFALVIGAGAGRGLMDVTGRTLLQHAAPARTLSRAFGVLEGLTMAALAIGAGLAALLVDRLGPAGAVAAVGVLLPLMLIATARPLLRIESGVTDRAAELATSAEAAHARRHG